MTKKASPSKLEFALLLDLAVVVKGCYDLKNELKPCGCQAKFYFDLDSANVVDTDREYCQLIIPADDDPEVNGHRILFDEVSERKARFMFERIRKTLLAAGLTEEVLIEIGEAA